MNPRLQDRRRPARGDGGSPSVEVALLSALVAAATITAASAFADKLSEFVLDTCDGMSETVTSQFPEITAECA